MKLKKILNEFVSCFESKGILVSLTFGVVIDQTIEEEKVVFIITE